MSKVKFTTLQKRLIAAGAIVGGYYIYKELKEKTAPIEHTITVTKKSWTRYDHVQVYTKDSGSGFKVPNGAYDISSEKKLKNPGTIEFTDTMSFSYPIYDTYYIYSINRWKQVQLYTSTGEGDSMVAHNAIPMIAGLAPKSKVIPEIGDMRISDTEIWYYIYGTDDATGEFVRICVDKMLYDQVKTEGSKLAFSSNGFTSPTKHYGVSEYHDSNLKNLRVVQ